MDTITERAKAHQEFCRNNGGRYNDYSYYLGATEQREIDIRRACKWLKEKKNVITVHSTASILKEFKQVMKEDTI